MTERPAVGAAVDLGLELGPPARRAPSPAIGSGRSSTSRPSSASAPRSTGRATSGRRRRRGSLETLHGYAATARSLGAATSRSSAPSRSGAPPTRPGWRPRSRQRTGVPLHVLTHEEEAYLTLIGVTEGRPVTHETLVVDIGGGSSEFCAVGPGIDRAGRRPAPRQQSA